MYYFNQRYYDPDLGRFLTEDPAGQYVNPYLYGGNNPLSFVDPNGEEFVLAAFLVAIIKGAAMAAAVNASMQYAITGTVNWDNVGNAAIGGALFYGVGSVLDTAGTLKTLAHAAAGGLSSSLQGGDFISGTIGAGVAEGLGSYIPNELGDTEQILAAAGIGGVSSFAAGGSFIHGAMAGGFGRAFNYLDEGHESQRESNSLVSAKDGKEMTFTDADNEFNTPRISNENVKILWRELGDNKQFASVKKGVVQTIKFANQHGFLSKTGITVIDMILNPEPLY